MDVFLVVRALDVNDAPLAAKGLKVAVDGGDARPLAATAQPGTFELQLPAGASRLEVRVDEPGFWPFSQRLKLVPGALPALDWDGPPHVNARDLESHSRGSDANVVVNLVLGQLRDAGGEVSALVAANPGKISYLTPQGHRIRGFPGPGIPVLVRTGSGWHRLNFLTSMDDVPQGTLLFAERQAAPRLLAVWVPKGRIQRGSQAPLPYHVFFHPSSAHIPRPYPFGIPWIDLVARYLLYDPVFNIGKAMINQHHVAEKTPVFVFPVGSPTESFGTLPRQANLLRTLQELGYWLQRMSGVQRPLQPVGRVAVSGFSAAADHVSTLLATPHPAFDGQHLREVYGLDLFRERNVDAMCDALRRWHRGGADGRKLRIYTTDARWWNGLRDLDASPVVTAGASNALEEETASSTTLFVPYSSFFVELKREVDPLGPGRLDTPPPDFDGTHQLIPALFMEHAVRNSTFSD